jgi:hypothetical protein
MSPGAVDLDWTVRVDARSPTEEQAKPPIFIVGCHRSGTSLLRMLLDSHPDISAGAEEASLSWLAHLDTDRWRTTLSNYGFSEDEWLAAVRSLFEPLHVRYAESQGKNRWAIKCPQNALLLEYIDKLYPTCQVVHIVRHPRDVVASNRRMYGKRRGAHYGGRWVHAVRSAEAVGAALGQDRYRSLRYEDLVSNPELILRSLLKWLGEPWSDDVLRFGDRTHSYRPRSTKKADPKFVIHTNSIGKGRLLGSVQSLLYVRVKANDLASTFGYRVLESQTRSRRH